MSRATLNGRSDEKLVPEAGSDVQLGVLFDDICIR